MADPQIPNPVIPSNLRGKNTPWWAEGLTALSAVGLATASAWIAYSHLAINHNLSMPPAVSADRITFESSAAGRLSYYADRQASGRPLVLVHSVNAAASAYEMSPLFNSYRGRRPVFALDLPGFGFSERTRRVYSPRLYEAAILDFILTQVGEAADVVALSLGCEFCARAARVEPEWFHSLVMLSPSGLSLPKEQRTAQRAGQKRTPRLLHPMFAMPLWARPLFDLIATRASIQFFLQQSFIGPVPTDLVEYAYVTAHQPGAEHAPLYFISGALFTPQVRQRIYEKLTLPTLVIYDRDAFTGFDMLPEVLARNPNWQAARIVPTLGLAQFERLSETVNTLERFWQTPG